MSKQSPQYEVGQTLYSTVVEGREVNLLEWTVDVVKSHAAYAVCNEQHARVDKFHHRTPHAAYLAARKKLVKARNRHNAAIEACDKAMGRRENEMINGARFRLWKYLGDREEIRLDSELDEIIRLAVEASK